MRSLASPLRGGCTFRLRAKPNRWTMTTAPPQPSLSGIDHDLIRSNMATSTSVGVWYEWLHKRFVAHDLPFTYEQFGDLAGVC